MKEKIFKVLVIDDDDSQIENLTMILEMAECDCHTAPTSDDALVYLSTHDDIDLIISDVHIDSKTVFTLYKEFAPKLPHYSNIPIIIMSSYIEEVTLRLVSEEMRIIGMFRKPLNLKDIVLVIKDVKEGNDLEPLIRKIRNY